MASGRELTRLQSIQESPIINHFAESLIGAATIRGFDQEHRFMETNFQRLDSLVAVNCYIAAAMQWLLLRMEVLSSTVFATAMLLVLLLPEGVVNPG